MLRKKTYLQRGETLVEVLLAFAILSLALVTVMRTMNGGLGNLFVSGQRSQVESQMRGQLAILQSAHQKAVANSGGTEAAEWNALIGNIGSDPQAAVNTDACTYTTGKNRLFFAANAGTSWSGTVGVKSTGTLATSSETPTPNGDTLWIEAKHTPKKDFARGYFDFYIKSCWDGNGSVREQAKMVTRLYDLEGTAAPVYDNMGFTASASGCSNNVNSSNPKISYTLTNPNPYPMGNVNVYVNNVLINSHNLNSSQTINHTTSAGYGSGDYEARAVLGSGAAVTVQFRINVCPIDIRGSDHLVNQCRPLYDFEGYEGYPPAYSFLSNPGPYAYPCRTSTAFGTVYTCTNYDVNYPSNVSVTGRYRMTLSYFDANCGDSSNETLSAGGQYYYRVEVYKNNTLVHIFDLNPDNNYGVYEFPQLAAGDTIGFRWYNNRFFPTSPGKDPDFVIQNIRLEKTD